jgi:hypothetical protein
MLICEQKNGDSHKSFEFGYKTENTRDHAVIPILNTKLKRLFCLLIKTIFEYLLPHERIREVVVWAVCCFYVLSIRKSFF